MLSFRPLLKTDYSAASFRIVRTFVNDNLLGEVGTVGEEEKGRS